MIKRLAFGLLATATFVLVPAAAASAGGVDPYDVLPGDASCDLTCQVGEACIGNDENLDGRICLPFGQSQVVKAVTTAVDETI